TENGKVDWDLFQQILSKTLLEDLHRNDTNQYYNKITQALNKAAQSSIPKTS
ncbi:hypothetical protein CHS0354_020855, partial [Potamilus streckersoni]